MWGRKKEEMWKRKEGERKCQCDWNEWKNGISKTKEEKKNEKIEKIKKWEEEKKNEKNRKNKEMGRKLKRPETEAPNYFLFDHHFQVN